MTPRRSFTCRRGELEDDVFHMSSAEMARTEAEFSTTSSDGGHFALSFAHSVDMRLENHESWVGGNLAAHYPGLTDREGRCSNDSSSNPELHRHGVCCDQQLLTAVMLVPEITLPSEGSVDFNQQRGRGGILAFCCRFPVKLVTSSAEGISTWNRSCLPVAAVPSSGGSGPNREEPRHWPLPSGSSTEPYELRHGANRSRSPPGCLMWPLSQSQS